MQNPGFHPRERNNIKKTKIEGMGGKGKGSKESKEGKNKEDKHIFKLVLKELLASLTF